MFLYVILITCAILPLSHGLEHNKRDEQELNDQKLRDSPDPSPPKWRDSHKNDYPSDDFPLAKWRNPHEIYRERLSESQIQNLLQDKTWIHYKRLLKMLLDRASVKTVDGLTYEGNLEIKIHTEDYNLLKKFASSREDNTNMLQNIDVILSKTMSESLIDYTADTLLNWKDYIYIMFWNTKTLLCLSSISMLLLGRQFLKANLSLGFVFKRLILFGWIIDFCFCWFDLLQEADMNNMVTLMKLSSTPNHCDPKIFSFWSYIMSFFGSSDDCKEYYHALSKDNFFSVTPLLVFSRQLGNIVSIPAGKVGKALGSFTSGILGQLPWGVSIILLPVVFVFAAIVLCIVLLIFLTGKSLGVSVLGIFEFNFRNGNVFQRAVQDVVSGNLTERNITEDVRPTVNTCAIIDSEESNNCKMAEVESSGVEKLMRISLTVNIPQTEDKMQTTCETKPMLTFDGSGNST